MGGTPTPKRTLIHGVLINGMYNFEDGIGAATAVTAPNAELNEMYERLRRVVAELAHKAWWHNECTIPIHASAECCPPLRGCRGFPCKGERQ